jgi:hypothetical protein
MNAAVNVTDSETSFPVDFEALALFQHRETLEKGR